MLAAERWHKIVQTVNERGSIRVSELGELCGVTDETIRRDLDKLEQEGKLLRSHGGAVSVSEAQQEIPYVVRETTNAEQKMRIANEAVCHIDEHARIILDASSTAWYMAKRLANRPLVVVTNSLKVAMELSGKDKIEVVTIGGELSRGSLSLVGPAALRALEAYRVRKAFVSCKGLHVERGVSESSESQAAVKRLMLAVSEHAYLLADSSKLGQQSFTFVSPVAAFARVITDSGVNRSEAARQAVEQLQEQHIQVTVVNDN